MISEFKFDWTVTYAYMYIHVHVHVAQMHMHISPTIPTDIVHVIATMYMYMLGVL